MLIFTFVSSVIFLPICALEYFATLGSDLSKPLFQAAFPLPSVQPSAKYLSSSSIGTCFIFPSLLIIFSFI